MRHFMLCMLMFLSGYLSTIDVGNAGTVTTILPVHVTVVPSCSVSASGIEFGLYAHQSVHGKGTIGVTCQRGIDYHIALSGGTHYESVNQARTMSGPNPVRTLPYRLYQDPGFSVEWGDHGHANTYPIGTTLRGSGTNIAQQHTVYGKIPHSNSHVPPGSYSDTVLVTVQF